MGDPSQSPGTRKERGASGPAAAPTATRPATRPSPPKTPEAWSDIAYNDNSKRVPSDNAGGTNKIMRQPDPMAVDKMSPATSRDAKKVTSVDYVVVSVADETIRFYTDQGIFPYKLIVKGKLPSGIFVASVTVTGRKVDFDFGNVAEEEATFDFGWEVEKGEDDPATLLKSQSSVKFIFRGDKTGAEIAKDVENLAIGKHIDIAAEIKYDSSYKAKGYGGLSPWLQVTYPDGTKIDVHMDQIEDEMLSGSEVMRAHRQSFLGSGGRLTPTRINRQTAPNLFTAKYKAIEEQTKGTNDLIIGSVPAILFIITLGASAAIVGPAPATGVPKGTSPRATTPKNAGPKAAGPKNAGTKPSKGPIGQGARHTIRSLVELTKKQMREFVLRVFNSNPLLKRLADVQKLKGQAKHKALIKILDAFEGESGITVQLVAKGTVQKARSPGDLASLGTHPGYLQIEKQVFKDTATLNQEVVHALSTHYTRLAGNGAIPKLQNLPLFAHKILDEMILAGGKLSGFLK